MYWEYGKYCSFSSADVIIRVFHTLLFIVVLMKSYVDMMNEARDIAYGTAVKFR